MTRKDKDALRRALVAARALDAQTAQAVDTMLKSRTWQEAAEYAAYHCQMKVLRLRPWMTPPMLWHDEVDPEGRYGGHGAGGGLASEDAGARNLDLRAGPACSDRARRGRSSSARGLTKKKTPPGNPQRG